MRKILLTSLVSFLLLALYGCASLANPSLHEKIDNRDGQIEEIRNNQNGFGLELGKVKQDQTVIAEKVNGLQQGLINQSNTGVQILQGGGGLLLVFGLATIFMILHFRGRAVKSEKTADIMAKEIATQNNPELNSAILKAAENTQSESQVYGLINRYQRKI